MSQKQENENYIWHPTVSWELKTKQNNCQSIITCARLSIMALWLTKKYEDSNKCVRSDLKSSQTRHWELRSGVFGPGVGLCWDKAEVSSSLNAENSCPWKSVSQLSILSITTPSCLSSVPRPPSHWTHEHRFHCFLISTRSSSCKAYLNCGGACWGHAFP